MLKNRSKINNAIRNDLKDSIKELSEKTRINISKLLDEAIEDLLKKYNSK